MTSQVYYIIVALMLASATLSVIFFIAWKTMGRKAYALSWSVAFLAATFQWFFNLQPNLFPSYETYWLATSAFAIVVITLGIRGHCQRTNCQYLPSNLWPASGMVFAAAVWSTVVEPNIGLRTAIIPAAACISLLLSALIIIKHRERTRPAEWAAATSLVLFAGTQGIAAVMAAMQGAFGDSAYQSLYLNFNFMTLPAGYMATSMFIIFMLASDISIEMKEIAIRDQLTGVLNRRGLGEQGAQAYANARRTGRPVSVVMTDIDRFKSINDDHGHACGDEALVSFSKLLIDGRRSEDILARVGGEEFALILQGTPIEKALEIADKLRVRIEADEALINGVTIKMTASFGVAAVSDKDTCLSDTIVRADRALYRSKRAGRNQVDLDSSQLLMQQDGSLKPISR